jgi:DNA-directed RNA polymerase subunit RPC12/RpoP
VRKDNVITISSLFAPFKKVRYSVEEIKQRVSGEHFILLSTEYINAHERLLWKCLVHNELFECSWHNISKISGCKTCQEVTRKSHPKKERVTSPDKTAEKFNSFLLKIEENGFSYISGEYVDQYSKLVFLCGNCGREFKSCMKLVAKNGCARCSRKEKLTPEEIRRRISGRTIRLVSTEYHNCHKKLDWRCLECGNLFESNWVNVSNGHGCPLCGRQIGERNHRWRGGIPSKYPREFDGTLKEQIRDRDGRACQYPDCNYDEREYGVKLHVHHINRDKSNCQPYNLISLCKFHHKAVEDRPEWQDYFYSITSDYEYR